MKQDGLWDVWVDTGGTFTDCLARDPSGTLHRTKVLSSSALRGRVRRLDGTTLTYDAAWAVPDGFLDGSRLAGLIDDPSAVTVMASTRAGRLQLDRPTTLTEGATFELKFDLEPPVLAAYLVTGCSPSQPLPAMRMRLATTRGTNALLERRGAGVAFFVTAGFGDLLRIGDQQRPDLFALDIQRPSPLYDAVYEVPERLRADGTVLRPLDLDALRPAIEAARDRRLTCAAVALLHSYRNDTHEQAVAQALSDAGFEHVSMSAAVSPTPKIVPRAETAVVNAYLAPSLVRYLERIDAAVGAQGGTLHVLNSAGGLARAAGFQPKDSLLSGPAGGVVGAATAGAACGHETILAFDMGGTSTDVSRSDGEPMLRFEHRVADARVAAPALAIETVAAGGGSVCRVADGRLRVGPESAGANPGPACYGVGGPLTLTDVNLLLGRLDANRFGIPIDTTAARRALEGVHAALERKAGRAMTVEALLEGCRAIANERMADAIRRISIQQGDDPRDYALVAFGGAGGQHACAVAEHLGVRVVVLPPDAGLLSARGLGAARFERMARRAVLKPLAAVTRSLERWLAVLASEATAAVVAEGVPRAAVSVRQQRVALRLAGQESTLEIDFRPGRLASDFRARYRATYGYAPPRRALEVAWIRVLAVSDPEVDPARELAPGVPDRRGPGTRGVAQGAQRTWLNGAWRSVPSRDRDDLGVDDELVGPASIHDPHASLFVEPGWTAQRSQSGAVIARHTENPP